MSPPHADTHLSNRWHNIAHSTLLLTPPAFRQPPPPPSSLRLPHSASLHAHRDKAAAIDIPSSASIIGVPNESGLDRMPNRRSRATPPRYRLPTSIIEMVAQLLSRPLGGVSISRSAYLYFILWFHRGKCTPSGLSTELGLALGRRWSHRPTSQYYIHTHTSLLSSN